MKKQFMLAAIPLIGTLALGACAGGDGDNESEIATLVAQQLQTSAAEDAIEPTTGPEATATEEEAVEDAPDSRPEVVFVPGGLFDEAERNLIMEKVVRPYIHYHDDLADHPTLLTVSIEHYEGDPSFLYTAEAIFETGVYNGWLMPATAGVLDWWVPDCMGPCPLSDSFRATYPEIVAILEP